MNRQQAAVIGKPTERWRDAAALTAVAGTIAAYFFPWLSLQKVFFQVDIAFMDHPIRVHAFEMIRAGRFPFWSDHLLCGFPLFAEGQAAILYPLSWLYFFLSPSLALNLFVAAHYLILGASSYLWLRSAPVSRSAAVCGSLTLCFSSFILVEHVLPSFLSVVAWLPLLLWLVEKSVCAPAPNALLAALVVGLMQLAGDPLGVLLSTMLAVSYVIFGIKRNPRGGWRPKLVAALLPPLLGTALAAVQIVPTLEFVQASTRSGGVSATEQQFVPSAFLLSGLSPNFFGDSFSRYVGTDRHVWEESLFFFCGWIPLLLLPFALGRGRRATFWILVAATAVALCVGDFAPISTHLWSLPLVRLFRWPTRVLLWYAVGVSVVTAHGLDGLKNGVSLTARSFRIRYLAVVATGVLALSLSSILRTSFIGPSLAVGATSPADVQRLRQIDWIVFATIWLLFLATMFLVRTRRIGHSTLTAVAVGTVLAGLVANQKPEGVSPDSYQREPDTARFLRNSLAPGDRFLSLTLWNQPDYPTDAEALRARAVHLPANFHLLFDLRSVSQFDLASTTTLARNKLFLLSPSPAILDLLAVQAIVSPRWVDNPPASESSRPGLESRDMASRLSGNFRLCFDGEARIHCRQNHLSRAFFVNDYRVMPREQERSSFLRTSPPDMRKLVVLEKGPALGTPHAMGPVLRQQTRFVVDEPGNVELEVESTSEALLVLADSYYPGWKAEVDGRPVEILVADGFVRAVAVPGGRHQVTFRYDARVFRAGLALSVVAAAAMALLWIFGLRRRQPPSSGEAA